MIISSLCCSSAFNPQIGELYLADQLDSRSMTLCPLVNLERRKFLPDRPDCTKHKCNVGTIAKLLKGLV